jgi:hypothetical protein
MADLGRTTWTEIEAAKPPMPKPDTLARVARVIMIDPDVLLAEAGYRDRDEAEPAEDEVRQVDDVVVAELRSMRTDIASLRGLVERLLSQSHGRPAPATKPTRREQTESR